MRARTLTVNDAVVSKALAAGAGAWLEALPALVAEIERAWSIRTGKVLPGGSEACVVEAALADGTEAVLKLLIPGDEAAARHEVVALRLAEGDGLARLLRADEAHGALLLERLGRSLDELARPLGEQHEILCAAAMRVWRPAPEASLPTGAEKGRWLVDFIAREWEALGRPCAERAVAYALACAERRIAAHRDERAVLVHGDVHRWNALEAPDGGFKLIDPDGLLAEPEYDVGVLMREDPAELLANDPRARARRLARRTGLDASAIHEWGAVERVSTGLLCTKVGIEPVGRDMLAAAELVATREAS